MKTIQKDIHPIKVVVNNLGQKTPVEVSEILYLRGSGNMYLKLSNGLMMSTHPVSPDIGEKAFDKMTEKTTILNLFNRKKYIELLCDQCKWITAFPR